LAVVGLAPVADGETPVEICRSGACRSVAGAGRNKLCRYDHALVIRCASLATRSAVMTSPLPTLPGPAAAGCCAPSVGLTPALDAERIATVARALGEPLRVRILDVVRRNEEPVCQCELIALFDIKQSLLSHHMKKLVDSGLVEVERRHKWAYYSISTEALEELISWLS
jgi:ArsR family transcriptional regulator